MTLIKVYRAVQPFLAVMACLQTTKMITLGLIPAWGMYAAKFAPLTPEVRADSLSQMMTPQ